MQHRKFLFELSFDPPDAADPSPRVAGVPTPEERDAAEAALAAARREALDEGHARGLREANEAVAARAAAALERIADHLGLLLAGAAAAEEARQADAARLAVAVVRRMLPAFAREAGFAEIEALVTECLRRRLDEPRIVLRVAEETFDQARSRIDKLAREAGYTGRVIVLADAQIGAGDCRVEWADGGVERDAARLWRDIDSALARTMTALAPAPTADAA